MHRLQTGATQEITLLYKRKMTVDRNGCHGGWHGPRLRGHVFDIARSAVTARNKTRPLAFCMSIALLTTAIGCHGSASYTIASLNMKRVSANEMLTLKIDASECYHWTNEFGELCVALRMNDGSILGKMFSRSSIASFVLSDPPVATGKNYKATRRTARFINHAGYSHTRSASLGGIIGVWNYDKPVIAGRFRLTTVQQSYSVLTGWAGKTHYLYVGEFRSVLNQTAGEAILAETEKDGMERKRPIGKPRRIQGPFPSKRQKDKK
jgi:hypothetical protein